MEDDCKEYNRRTSATNAFLCSRVFFETFVSDTASSYKPFHADRSSAEVLTDFRAL